jgi:hypothetical protein
VFVRGQPIEEIVLDIPPIDPQRGGSNGGTTMASEWSMSK